MRNARVFGLITICLLAACSSKQHQPSAAILTAPTHQLPTATEVFDLRSRCAKLGQQILDNSVIGSALTQSVVSNYNEKTDRCYVELTVQSADLTQPNQTMEQYLFDGQTKEMLAVTKDDKGVKSGIVFKDAGILGFDAVDDYIGKKMADSSQ